MRKVPGFGLDGKQDHLAKSFFIFPNPSKQDQEEYLKLEQDGIFSSFTTYHQSH
jgi:hypothetical protein